MDFSLRQRNVFFLILTAGASIAAGIFIFNPNFFSRPAEDFSKFQWTEQTGAGIAAAACGSATVCGSSGSGVVCTSCSGGNPTVTFTWSASAEFSGKLCQLVINGSAIDSGFDCGSGTYSWPGASNGASYTYEIKVQ